MLVSETRSLYPDFHLKLNIHSKRLAFHETFKIIFKRKWLILWCYNYLLNNHCLVQYNWHLLIFCDRNPICLLNIYSNHGYNQHILQRSKYNDFWCKVIYLHLRRKQFYFAGLQSLYFSIRHSENKTCYCIVCMCITELLCCTAKINIAL